MEPAVLFRVPLISIPLYLQGFAKTKVGLAGQINVFPQSVEWAVGYVFSRKYLPVVPRASGLAVSLASTQVELHAVIVFALQ